MLDLIVRGGLVVTPNGTGRWDVGIADGKIATVAAPEAMNGIEAGQIVDARDRIVIPGGIDPLHQYMLYTNADYLCANGQIYYTYPSLKPEQDRLALWDGTVTGEISTVATDGICTLLCVKVQGRCIDDTTGGNAGVEPRLSVMYSEMVVRRGYSLESFVDIVSTNAARIMGLYPRKGVIAVGSDADLVVFDPGVKRRVRVEDLHETDYSPWEGQEVAG